MSSSQEITNWREKPPKESENKTPEFRGSPHVYKNRYAPTRDEPYGNHNPRFDEKPSQQMKQSASLRRQEFLNTSPIRKIDPPQHTGVEGNVQNFVQQFTSHQQSVVPQPQQQVNQQQFLQRGNPQFVQQLQPLQPQFQQRNGNIQNPGAVPQTFFQPQQQIPNLQPQFQQRNGCIQNSGAIPQQLFPPQVRVPNTGVVPQQLIQPQQRVLNLNAPFQQSNAQNTGVVSRSEFQKPKQESRNQNFKQPHNQQRVERNPRQQNGNQKSEKQFSGLTESNATKYRDQRIKQMAAMNKNEVQNIPQNQQKQNSRPNKPNQKPQQQQQQQPQQQQQQQQNKGRKQQNKGRKQQPRQQSSQPEKKPAETIVKDWIVQPIISNEVLMKKFGTDDPKCQQVQKNPENTSIASRDKRIQHNSNKNCLEDSYKKMNSESFSVDKKALPRIPQPEVKYFPRKTFVTFRPKNKSHVLLTSAISMNTIFIRSFKMNHEYCSVVKAFNEMEKTGVPFKKMPEVNGMVLTKYKNICMRAHVTKSFDDHVEVFFTDLGFRENKTLSELQNVNILSHTSVTYIHQYRLKNIPEIAERSEEVLKYLKNLYERNFELITDDIGKECDLIDFQTDESVCSRILSILGIELPEVVEKKEIVVEVDGGTCDDYIDADLYGPETSVNIGEDFVDQNQSNSLESLSSLSEKSMNEKNNESDSDSDSDEVLPEKNKEDHSINYNEVEETSEAQPDYETSKTEQKLHEKEEDIYDLSEITIEKLVISEKEEEEIVNQIENTQEPEHVDTKNDQFDEQTESSTSADSYLMQNISKSKITEGKNITVIVSDKSELRDGSLSIMNECDYNALKKLQEEIQNFCEKNNANGYKPRENEICLAKHSDGKWHRATCLKYLSDTKTVVSFIDLGNLSKVSNTDIKKCIRRWTKSCFSVSCFIEDLDEVTPEMETRLNQLIPLDKLIVDEIKYVQVSDDEEICVIELKNVIRILREEGLMF